MRAALQTKKARLLRRAASSVRCSATSRIVVDARADDGEAVVAVAAIAEEQRVGRQAVDRADIVVVAVAEVDVEALDLGGQVVGEGVLDTAADRPAAAPVVVVVAAARDQAAAGGEAVVVAAVVVEEPETRWRLSYPCNSPARLAREGQHRVKRRVFDGSRPAANAKRHD
jgi:hypothetical protein